MGTSSVEIININKLPEKIILVIDWELRRFTAYRHSADAYRALSSETLNAKTISYYRLRRHLKKNPRLKLDSGVEIVESILIN